MQSLTSLDVVLVESSAHKSILSVVSCVSSAVVSNMARWPNLAYLSENLVILSLAANLIAASLMRKCSGATPVITHSAAVGVDFIVPTMHLSIFA